MVLKAALHELQATLLGRGGFMPYTYSPPSRRQRLDSLSSYHEALVARISPLCEILYLTMAVDGSESTQEQRVLQGAVRLLTEGELPPDVLNELLQRFRAAMLADDDVHTRLALLGAQLAGHREDAEAAFLLAVAIASADGPLSIAERNFLAELAAVLGVNKAHGQQLLQEATSCPG